MDTDESTTLLRTQIDTLTAERDQARRERDRARAEKNFADADVQLARTLVFAANGEPLSDAVKRLMGERDAATDRADDATKKVKALEEARAELIKKWTDDARELAKAEDLVDRLVEAVQDLVGDRLLSTHGALEWLRRRLPPPAVVPRWNLLLGGAACDSAGSVA